MSVYYETLFTVARSVSYITSTSYMYTINPILLRTLLLYCLRDTRTFTSPFTLHPPQTSLPSNPLRPASPASALLPIPSSPEAKG